MLSSGTVRVITVANERLLVGGDFYSAGGIASTRGIAEWDAPTWKSFGNGVSYNTGSVYSIVSGESGNTYIAGSFYDQGGDSNADHIAKYNGATWSAVGNGVNTLVRSIVIDYVGNLYIGGQFFNAGDVTDADYVAVLNGFSWAAMGTGLESLAYTLHANHNAEGISVGGHFYSAGGVAGTCNFASWQADAWTGLGLNYSDFGDLDSVYAIEVSPSGELYIGGVLNLSGGATHIAKWGKKI